MTVPTTAALAPLHFPIIPTFSGLDRWLACELSDVLARADEPSEASAAGTARHAFLERVTNLVQVGLRQVVPEGKAGLSTDPVRLTLADARELALAEADPEHIDRLKAIPVDSPIFRFGEVSAEVTLALDLETGAVRELGRGLGRDYAAAAERLGEPLRPSELVGTIDRLGALSAEGGYVGDYKGRSFTKEPDKAAQFLAGALAAARLYRWSWVELEALVQVGDEWHPRRARVDLVYLDQLELELQERRAKALQNVAAFLETGRLPPANMGACAYCDRLVYCPARGALVREVVAGQNQLVTGLVTAGQRYLDPIAAVEALRVEKVLEETVEKLKAARKDYGRREAFALNDGTGRWYGMKPGQVERELGDGVKIAEELAELFGPEPAKQGVKVTASLKGVESAARALIAKDPAKAKAEKWTISGLAEKALERLQKIGLLSIRTASDPTYYKPAPTTAAKKKEA